ncbi:MAG: penicillin-binding transpeptidase domain-containing protein [Oscillospiraceae bacterium]
MVSTANNSYFTDEVITDVAEKFVEVFGLTDDPADADGYVRTAFEKAVSKVYNGGYKIYTTQNPKIQDIAESVFENTNYANYTDSKGEPLQAAITIVDPYTGDVVAMVGGTGAKEVDRGWNWATSARQPGSATKPVSVYAPALDNGTITAASAIDDYPVRDLPGYGAWPSNSGSGFRGLTSLLYRPGPLSEHLRRAHGGGAGHLSVLHLHGGEAGLHHPDPGRQPAVRQHGPGRL